MLTIKLDHPTDPRYLLVYEEPDRVSPDDLFAGTYGRPLIAVSSEVDLVYAQPGGPGTDWVKPSHAS